MYFWWKALLVKLYTTLVVNNPVEPVDLIVVMAGRMERKEYGLNLFRSGIAPRLVLSIGRFEVSKMARINLDGLAELKALRDTIPPDDRHFFTTVDHTGVHHENVKLWRWSTYGEALAILKFLNEDTARRVMIISSDVHLRRVALTFAKVFRDSPFQFSYCAVPSTFLNSETWWIDEQSRRFVFNELVKLVGYRIILSLPVVIAQRLLRLKSV
jgi:DUF218 domain